MISIKTDVAGIGNLAFEGKEVGTDEGVRREVERAFFEFCANGIGEDFFEGFGKSDSFDP
jgi:hypothetical protein